MSKCKNIIIWIKIWFIAYQFFFKFFVGFSFHCFVVTLVSIYTAASCPRLWWLLPFHVQQLCTPQNMMALAKLANSWA